MNVIPNSKAKILYNYIRKNGVVSKQLLQEATGMKGSTLTRTLEELIADRWIEEVGFGESTGGRPPILYQIRADRGFVFGLDISRSQTGLALCDLRFQILESRTWRMTLASTPEAVCEQMGDAMNEMLRTHQIPKEQLIGVGIGAVGPLDRTEGRITRPLNFPSPGWKDVPICEIIGRRMEVPCLLDNGANAALLGEYWMDPTDERMEHILYIHGGIGLRSAMLTNGRLVYGAVDMEGAIGQMIIQSDGVPYREPGGNYGCLESYASIYALVQMAVTRLKQGRESLLSSYVERPEQIQFQHLVAALRENDPMTMDIFTQSAVYFGIGLANMLNMLHPQKVILGGPMFNTQELFFNVATETAVKKTYYYPEYQVQFSKGKLRETALAVGAAIMMAGKLTD